MSHHHSLKRIEAEITSHLSHVAPAMLTTLVHYVFGVLVLQHCGQIRIATFLGELWGESFHNVRQRLRELTYEGEAKRGKHRRELKVSDCFAPLLRWVLSKLPVDDKQVVLALDATYLGERFVILAVSVVVSQTAIPVAWHIQYGNTQGKWTPIWKRLLNALQPALPDEWTIYALTDSGLRSKVLFEQLESYGWVPMMRVDASQGLFQKAGQHKWVALRSLVWRGMSPRCIRGLCFKGKPITCTIICQWDAQYEHPCLVITSLHVRDIRHPVYAIRYWIECGFKDFKRGLFHWEQTKMRCPQRAERLWLVLSIALLLLTAWGDTTSMLAGVSRQQCGLSAPVFGLISWLVALLRHDTLPDHTHLSPYRFPT